MPFFMYIFGEGRLEEKFSSLCIESMEMFAGMGYRYSSEQDKDYVVTDQEKTEIKIKYRNAIKLITDEMHSEIVWSLGNTSFEEQNEHIEKVFYLANRSISTILDMLEIKMIKTKFLFDARKSGLSNLTFDEFMNEHDKAEMMENEKGIA